MTTTSAIQFDAIPKALRERAQWVVWRLVDKGDGPTKLPFRADGGGAAKSNDPSTWSTFEAARAAFQRGGYAGVGFMFDAADPYVGIDLDGCRTSDGPLAPWAQTIVTDFGCYAEVSPSANGIKLFGIGRSPLPSGKNKKLAEDRVCDKAPSIEVYDRVRFFAMTGWHVEGTAAEPTDVQEQLDALCAMHWPTKAATHGDNRKRFRDGTFNDGIGDIATRARKYVAKLPPAISGSGGHDATFHAACVLTLGFELSIDDAKTILLEYNARCDPPWSERELDHKLESAAKQPGPRGYLRDAVRDGGSGNLPEAAPYGNFPEGETIGSGNLPEAIPEPEFTPEPDTSDYTDGAPPTDSVPEAGPPWLTVQEVGRCPVYKEGLSTVTSGFSVLDNALRGGFRPESMYIIGGRTGSAKSTLALNITRRAAIAGVNVLLLKLEESPVEAVWRMHAAASQVSLRKLLDGARHEKEERQRLIDGWNLIRTLPIRISDVRALSRIRAISEAHVNDGGQLVVIDQLTMIDGGGLNPYERATNASNELRLLARQLRVPILLVCQVNRVASKEKDRLSCTDLRDSGALENDAAAVLLIDRVRQPDVYRWRTDPLALEIVVGKNRYGASTRHEDKPLELHWWPDICRIEDVPGSGGAA